MELAGKLTHIEIKSGSSLHSDFWQPMAQCLELAGDDATSPALIYGGDTGWNDKHGTAIPWRLISEV